MDEPPRRPTPITVSQRFAAAAREAQQKGQYGRAAALFRAALLLLTGEPIDAASDTAETEPSTESLWKRAILPRPGQTATVAADAKPRKPFNKLA